MHGTPLATVRKWQGFGIWALRMSRMFEDVVSVQRMEGKVSGVSGLFWLSRHGCSMETHHCVRRKALPCSETEDAFSFSGLCSQVYRGLGKDWGCLLSLSQ